MNNEKNIFCLREKEIRDKIKSGKIDAAAEAHIRECQTCRETALIVTWMNHYPAQTAKQALAGKQLTEPDFLRHPAHRKPVNDIRLTKKALRPIVAAQALALIGLFFGAGILIYSLFSGRGLFSGSILRENLLDGTGMFIAANPLALATFVILSIFLLISELKWSRS